MTWLRRCLVVLGLLAPAVRAGECGTYPWEFATICPMGVMVAVCDEGPPANWVFVGCWNS